MKDCFGAENSSAFLLFVKLMIAVPNTTQQGDDILQAMIDSLQISTSLRSSFIGNRNRRTDIDASIDNFILTGKA